LESFKRNLIERFALCLSPSTQGFVDLPGDVLELQVHSFILRFIRPALN
jgi:hypothetical protein